MIARAHRLPTRAVLLNLLMNTAALVIITTTRAPVVATGPAAQALALVLLPRLTLVDTAHKCSNHQAQSNTQQQKSRRYTIRHADSPQDNDARIKTLTETHPAERDSTQDQAQDIELHKQRPLNMHHNFLIDTTKYTA